MRAIPPAMATIVIDGQPYELADGYDPTELHTRIAQALFRCEVETMYLADGRTMLVNWRADRTVILPR